MAACAAPAVHEGGRMRHLAAMLSAVLVASGTFLAAYGCLRGYGAARAAMLPLARQGDATRTLVEASRPVAARTRVQASVRRVLLAVGWLALAMYGLYLATVGFEVGA